MSSLRSRFLRYVAQTSDQPMGLEITGGSGVYLEDRSGRRYMDLISGIGPSILGHQHPRIVGAIREQADHFLHTLVYGEMILSPQVQLAELLVAQLPARLDNVYFLSTGTEATEAAMKLAKRYTGRYEIASFHQAYHGSTQGAASLMSDPYFTAAFRPLLPQIRHLVFNDEASLPLITDRTAAVIVETVRAESGLYKPTGGFLQALRRRCDETGTLLILDEIQAGYGRTGHLFAFQAYGIEPDILLLGKGFGGGMPLAAVVAPRDIMQVLSHDPVLGHITTFGGHPVCCAAGLAVLETLLESDLVAQVPAAEQQFLNRLQHPLIQEVRHAGLWLAIELETPGLLREWIGHCLDLGLITDWFLFNDRSLRICPPLIITPGEIDLACDLLLKALDRVEG